MPDDRRHTRSGRRSLEGTCHADDQVTGQRRSPSRRSRGDPAPSPRCVRAGLRPTVERHGCHCPVKMACCEAGLCHGGMDSTPSSGPSWSGCRDEAPLRPRLPRRRPLSKGPPSVSAPRADETGAPISFVVPICAESPRPAPGDPPSSNLHRPLLTVRGSSPAPPGAPRGTVARSPFVMQSDGAPMQLKTCVLLALLSARGLRVGVRSGDALGLDPRHRRKRPPRGPRHRSSLDARRAA